MTVLANFNVLAEETLLLMLLAHLTRPQKSRYLIGFQKIKEKQSARGASLDCLWRCSGEPEQLNSIALARLG